MTFGITPEESETSSFVQSDAVDTEDTDPETALNLAENVHNVIEHHDTKYCLSNQLNLFLSYENEELNFEDTKHDTGEEKGSSRVHVYIEPLKDDSGESRTPSPYHKEVQTAMTQSMGSLDLDRRLKSTYDETLDYTSFSSIVRSSSQWSVDTQYSGASLGLAHQLLGSRPHSTLSNLSNKTSSSKTGISSRVRSCLTPEKNPKKEDFSMQASLQPFHANDTFDFSQKVWSTSPGYQQVSSETSWNRSVTKRRQSTPYIGTQNLTDTGCAKFLTQPESFTLETEKNVLVMYKWIFVVFFL